MACDTNWTLRFPSVKGRNGPFEIRPVEMALQQGRREFDHCRMEFEWEVGETMKPHTHDDGGVLSDQQRVLVCLDGEPMQAMLFKPDNVTYAPHATHIELVDLQKALDSGVIDKQWSEVTLRDAYNYVFEHAKKSGLIKEMKFTVPEEMQDTELIGGKGLTPDDGLFGSGIDFTFHQWTGIATKINKWSNPLEVSAIESNDTKRMVDSYFAADFNKVSPLKAIWELNEKYRLQTWVDQEGVLWVGAPEAGGKYHVAAQDDDRVWHFNNANISHPRSPVKAVVVEGKWVDEPGMGGTEDWTSWFDTSSSNPEGFGDFRATGTAARTDVENGLTFTVKNTDAKRDALDTAATVALREEMKKQNSGTVEIDPAVSGDFTPVRSVSVGDYIHIVPDDDQFEDPSTNSGLVGQTPDYVKRNACGTFIHNDLYVVTGIQHNLNPQGGWTVNLDVALYPDVPIKSGVRYFDPHSEEYKSSEQVYDGDWFESSFL